jgi:hypothetical protein
MNQATECLVIDGPWMGAKVEPYHPAPGIICSPVVCRILDGKDAGLERIFNFYDLKPIKREAKS